MAEVQWLKPEQAAEIEFVERTPHADYVTHHSGDCCHGRMRNNFHAIIYFAKDPRSERDLDKDQASNCL